MNSFVINATTIVKVMIWTADLTAISVTNARMFKVYKIVRIVLFIVKNFVGS
jgi:hypothetical protein